MACLLTLNVYMRKMYAKDKNKKNFSKPGRKE